MAAVGHAIGNRLQVRRRAHRVVIAGDGQHRHADPAELGAQVGPGQGRAAARIAFGRHAGEARQDLVHRARLGSDEGGGEPAVGGGIELLQELYAESPPWLDTALAATPDPPGGRG